MINPQRFKDSSKTFADLAKFQPGDRHEMPCLGGGLMSIRPFGEHNDQAHVVFREHSTGTIVDSKLFTPTEIEALAAERLPLNHAWRVVATSAKARNAGITPAEVLKIVREQMKKDPKEADPKATNPESVQSPAEAKIFNQLNTPELVKSTLSSVFAGGRFKPGHLIDTTYQDAAKTLPIREVIHHVNAQGQPILHGIFTFQYDAKGLLLWLITRTVESISSSTYRRVAIEQTLKSTSFSAGLLIGAGGPSSISSGPQLGDPVFSLGRALGGASVQFNTAYTKTYLRLRLEAELKVQEEIGKWITTITRVPRA